MNLSLAERHSRLVSPCPITGCWWWMNSPAEDGYGRIYYDGHLRLAHRVAWELEHGIPIPPGLVAMHTCDQPPCVNPAHLRLGTFADNNRDRARKGRSAVGEANGRRTKPESTPRGEKAGRAKLTEIQVTEARRLFDGGTLKISELARMFGLQWTAMAHVVRRETWTHIP